jgi:tRNA nucleotidyltransferase (CCA-adding enzyme)
MADRSGRDAPRSVGVAERQRDGEELLSAVVARPGGRELLELAGSRSDAPALVGGATRDLLLGRSPRELDVVVGAEAATFAGELALEIAGASAAITVHDRFGTAVVEWDGGRIDIAERRAETYPHPGALPDVRPGSLEDDLRRRDFTVNSIAVVLGGSERGHVHAATGALADLTAGRLRVLHERSFIDDPTRLLRLARYGARLGFQAEPRTAELAASALAEGALSTVSQARVGAELRLAVTEPDPLAALAALGELGVLAAIDPRLRFDDELAQRGLAMLPEDGRPEVLLLAVLLLPLSLDTGRDGAADIGALLDGFEFTTGERDAVLRTAERAPALVEHLQEADRPSRLAEAASASTIEGVALAGALASERPPYGAADAAHEWLRRWRHVRLAINGDDLIAAGIPSGPEIGRRLAHALSRRLDGELADGREAELRAALEPQV